MARQYCKWSTKAFVLNLDFGPTNVNININSNANLNVNANVIRNSKCNWKLGCKCKYLNVWRFVGLTVSSQKVRQYECVKVWSSEDEKANWLDKTSLNCFLFSSQLQFVIKFFIPTTWWRSEKNWNVPNSRNLKVKLWVLIKKWCKRSVYVEQHL